MSEPFNAPHDARLYEMMCREIEEKLLRAMPRFVDRFPHVSSTEAEGLVYEPRENNSWTASFHTGMLCLAYERTGSKAFLANAEAHLDSFESRIDSLVNISHDLGFLYTLSCVAFYKLTGNERARAVALKAARVLAGRYNEKGRYLQAWGEFDVGTPYVKIIVDTMLNLPLLFWAGEETGDTRYTAIATAHANTCADYLVRGDYSSFHTYLMDPVSGKAIEGRTHQGFHDDSTWARGQAWVVTGFALAYRYTQNPRFLEVSQKAVCSNSVNPTIKKCR